MTEKQRVKAILVGETKNFDYFVDTYQDMAITIAYRICGNRQDAEDITQNAFVKAYHNLSSFKGNSKFSSWFYRIVYNTALTSMRKINIQKEYVDFQFVIKNEPLHDNDVLMKIETKERNELINKAISKLHPSESIVLTLYYLEDMPTKEIAQITGLSKSNIKVKLYRGRQNLAHLLSATQL